MAINSVLKRSSLAFLIGYAPAPGTTPIVGDTISPSSGAYFGVKAVTATSDASSFGADEGTVTVGGHSAEIVSWAVATVKFLTPDRVNTRGAATVSIKDSGGSVVYTETYTYYASVRQEAMLDIQSTLQGITEANGYENTLESTSVVLYTHPYPKISSPPTIVIISEDDDIEIDTDRFYMHDMEVEIHILTMHDAEKDPGSTEAIMNSLLADVQRIMATDVTHGKWVIDANEDRAFKIPDETFAIQGIIYKVQFGVLNTDPRTKQT